jgi:integrase
MSRVKRAGGDVFVYRWRQIGHDGVRRPRSRVIGAIRELRTETAAWQKLESLNINPNIDLSLASGPPQTFGELVQIYREKELVTEAYSTQKVYGWNLDNWILPKWRSNSLHQMEQFPGPLYEQWLASLCKTKRGKPMTNGTKAKIKNIMSAVFTYALRWNWIQRHPFRDKRVQQSAKGTKKTSSLTVEELKLLFGTLKRRERALVLLDVPQGLRVGELLALQWLDIDWHAKTIDIRKAIWHQHLGPVKTEDSEAKMPLDDAMIDDLKSWRKETPYANEEDYIFASPKMKGAQPYWPESLITHIQKAAQKAGISKHLSWHVFRHTFSTLLIDNGENVKTVQDLMRHANPKTTLELYAKSIDHRKRAAQRRIVSSILPERQNPPFSRPKNNGRHQSRNKVKLVSRSTAA